MKLFEIFIPNDVPSSKNGKTWTGKYLVSKPAVARYEKEAKAIFKNNAQLFRQVTADIELPLRLHFQFHRKTKRRFDYINIAQLLCDMMVRYDWIDDDDASHLLPVFEPFTYNKDSPGVTISL